MATGTFFAGAAVLEAVADMLAMLVEIEDDAVKTEVVKVVSVGLGVSVVDSEVDSVVDDDVSEVVDSSDVVVADSVVLVVLDDVVDPVDVGDEDDLDRSVVLEEVRVDVELGRSSSSSVDVGRSDGVIVITRVDIAVRFYQMVHPEIKTLKTMEVWGIKSILRDRG